MVTKKAFWNKKPVTVWVVGKFIKIDSEGIVWEMKGIVSSEGVAIAACIDPDYFIGPMVINSKEELKHCQWPGCYYPKHGDLNKIIARFCDD